MNFFIQYKYLLTPFLIWFCIQTFKVFYDLVKTKKFNFKRIMGAGGMPSSHSAVVTCLATMVGKSQGIETPGLSGVQVSERLVEVLGHTPTQVVVGAIIGIIVGLII